MIHRHMCDPFRNDGCLALIGRLGRLGQKLRATASMFSAAAVTGSLAPLRLSADQPDAIALPYSVPLGLGTLAVLLLGQATGGTP